MCDERHDSKSRWMKDERWEWIWAFVCVCVCMRWAIHKRNNDEQKNERNMFARWYETVGKQQKSRKGKMSGFSISIKDDTIYAFGIIIAVIFFFTSLSLCFRLLSFFLRLLWTGAKWRDVVHFSFAYPLI